MKKRILGILLAVLLVVSIFGLTACDLEMLQGPQGEQGEAGIDGKDGIDGVDGVDGEDGEDGMDGITPLLRINEDTNEWEVSYDDGETWISLGVVAIGPEGEKGETGNTGDKGDKGDTGEQGPVGPQGPQGEPGEKGETGENGKTPYIQDGYWYIDGVNTGVKAEGSDGEDLTACEHEFGEWIVELEPTCDSIGVNYRVCSKCSAVEHDHIEKLEHRFVELYEIQNDHYNYTVMAYCSVCGTAHVLEKEIDAIHQEVIDPAVAPTCTKTGLTEGKHCSGCGEIIIAQEVIDMIDHNYVDGKCTMCGVSSSEYFIFTLLDDDTWSIKGDDNDIHKVTEIVIPDTYFGKAVTRIDNFGFWMCNSLTNVVIPEGITHIGRNAFTDCTNLISITIPDSVTEIGIYAFSGCSSLNNVTIPSGITVIDQGTFGGCSSLTSVTIPSTVTEIRMGAFNGCSNLVNITIPNSVTLIGEQAFFDCSKLTSIIIPNSVKSIGNHAFYNCSKLTSIIIPNSVTNIGESAFYNCSSLASITIPESVIYIGERAFIDCSSLVSVIFEDTEGWQAVDSYGYTDISAEDLKDTEKAAQYLTLIHRFDHWYKN